MWMSTTSTCVCAVFTWWTITCVVLLFCNFEVFVDLFGCPVLPVWLFVCVFEFDVLVSVLECGSTFALRTQDVINSHFLLHFRFHFLLFFSSSHPFLSLSFSLFLLLFFFLSSLFSFDNGVSADGWEDSVWMRLLCAWALCRLSCGVEVRLARFSYLLKV